LPSGCASLWASRLKILSSNSANSRQVTRVCFTRERFKRSEATSRVRLSCRSAGTSSFLSSRSARASACSCSRPPLQGRHPTDG
jgi:hypothetical protein